MDRPSNIQTQEELLDRQISHAMRASIASAPKSFTGDLMSAIAREERSLVIAPRRRLSLPWIVIGLGVLFIVVALLVPAAPAQIDLGGSATIVWVALALGLVAMLSISEWRPSSSR